MFDSNPSWGSLRRRAMGLKIDKLRGEGGDYALFKVLLFQNHLLDQLKVYLNVFFTDQNNTCCLQREEPMETNF